MSARDPTGHQDARLLHGVASGEPTQRSVLLWTRVTVDDSDASVGVSWEIARADSREIVGRGLAVAAPDADHTVRVVVEGLEPGVRYDYAFATPTDRVAGRTATLPLEAERLRVAVVCCARWGWNDFAAYGRIADEAPDLVLHLGDYIYEVGELPPAGPPTRPRHDARSLDDYRMRYAQQRSHTALLRLHAAAPMLALWDDHEVADNAPTRDDEAARARRAAGLRAWAEWMPVLLADPAAPLDRSLGVGGLFDLTIVDARYSGREPVDTDGPSTPNGAASLLDDVQWSNIERRSAEVRAPWHLLANQIQVAPTRLAYVPSRRRPYIRPLVNPDQWDGFPAERTRLYEAVTRSGSRTVILSGDLHSAWSRELHHRRRRIACELTCPSVAGETYASAFRRRAHLPAPVLRGLITLLNRGIDLLELDRHGHLLLDITADRIDATFVVEHPLERRTVTITHI